MYCEIDRFVIIISLGEGDWFGARNMIWRMLYNQAFPRWFRPRSCIIFSEWSRWVICSHNFDSVRLRGSSTLCVKIMVSTRTRAKMFPSDEDNDRVREVEVDDTIGLALRFRFAVQFVFRFSCSRDGEHLGRADHLVPATGSSKFSTIRLIACCPLVPATGSSKFSTILFGRTPIAWCPRNHVLVLLLA